MAFCMGQTDSKYISVLDKMGAAAEWTEPRGPLRSRLRATLSRPPGAPLPVLLPRNILKRHRRRRGGHGTRYLSRGARWTIACDAQKRGLLAHLGASAGPPCRLIYYQNNQEMGKSQSIQSRVSALFAPSEVQTNPFRVMDSSQIKKIHFES